MAVAQGVAVSSARGRGLAGLRGERVSRRPRGALVRASGSPDVQGKKLREVGVAGSGGCGPAGSGRWRVGGVDGGGAPAG